MTLATNSATGEIKLAGDLAGSNDANAPELTTVLSTPGTFVVPTMTVDAKGRTTAIANSAPATVAALIPDATASVKGVVKIGTNISVTNTAQAGYQTINFGGALIATTPTGLCNNGATYSFKVLRDGAGPLKVELAASALTQVQDLINAVNAVVTPFSLVLVAGNLQMTSNTTGVTSKVSITEDKLFQYMMNYVALESPVDGMGDATIYIPDATSSVKGVAKFSSTDFTVSAGGVSMKAIADATTSSKGIVQIGSGLNVTAGVVSAPTLPDATTSSKGIMQVGSGLSVTGGVVSVPDASASVKGVVQIGANLQISSGLLTTTFGNATTGAHGLVRIGSGINVSGGVISVPLATTSQVGVGSVGAGLNVDGSGVISLASPLPTATTSALGIVQIGSGFSVSSGVVSVDPTPDATTSSKGLVQIGSGLSVASGVVSANAIPDATTSTKGIVQVGTNLTVSSGVLSCSIPNATAGVPGLVSIGSGLSVSSGVVSLSLSDATTSTKGVVQIGSGLSVASGVVSANTATNSTLGVVKSANTSNITITAGAVDVGANIPKKDAANTFTKAQAVALVSGGNTGATTVTPDFSNGNVFFYTATGNFTLGAPTNVVAGGTYIIIIQQDATGSRTCTFNSAYKFGAGAVNTLTTTANKYDVISIVAQASGVLLTTTQLGF